MSRHDQNGRDKASRAMQIVSVRFGSDQTELIQAEATATGVSASQYIRDSAYARAVLSAARRKRSTMALWVALIDALEKAGHDELTGLLRGLQDAAGLEDQPD